MTNFAVENPNDIILIVHPILDNEGKWTKRVYLSIAHSQHSTLPEKDIASIQELTALGCAAIHSVDREPWLREFLEDEILQMEEVKASYTVKDNIISLNFNTKTEGEA